MTRHRCRVHPCRLSLRSRVICRSRLEPRPPAARALVSPTGLRSPHEQTAWPMRPRRCGCGPRRRLLFWMDCTFVRRPRSRCSSPAVGTLGGLPKSCLAGWRFDGARCRTWRNTCAGCTRARCTRLPPARRASQRMVRRHRVAESARSRRQAVQAQPTPPSRLPRGSNTVLQPARKAQLAGRLLSVSRRGRVGCRFPCCVWRSRFRRDRYCVAMGLTKPTRRSLLMR